MPQMIQVNGSIDTWDQVDTVSRWCIALGWVVEKVERFKGTQGDIHYAVEVSRHGCHVDISFMPATQDDVDIILFPGRPR